MSEQASSEQAIILAPRGRDAAVAAGMLEAVGIPSTAVKTVAELVCCLSQASTFVVLTEEAVRDADLRDLHAWLSAQPEWSDLPFILLTSQGGSIERNPAAARYLEMLGNVTFLERPFHPTTLVSLAKAAQRARGRQYEARTRLEDIRRAAQQLRVAMEAGHLGAWSLDIATRQLTASAECQAHYGRRADESFTYGDLLRSIHPDDIVDVRARMERAARGESNYDVEYRCIWPDGQVHWVHVLGGIDTASGGAVTSMSGVSLAITERKTASLALLRSEERFRAAVAAVQGVLWTNNAAGEMLGEQVGWSKLTGQAFDAYQGYGWADAVHPDDAQPTIDAWAIAVAERRPFVFEHRVRLRNGEWGNFSVRAVPALEADGSIREWVGVHTDITHQRAVERDLADLARSLEERVEQATADLVASRARLRSILETSFQYVAELAPDGIVLDANATSLAGIGADLDAVVGRPFWDTPWFANTPDAPARVRGFVARARDGATAREELELVLPAGPRNFDLSLRPVRGGDGSILALVSEAIDVTDRRMAEEKLLQSQKLETIGQLTGGVAHDFNNLLTPIIGSLELLGNKLDGDARAQRWVSAGLQSAERAKILVNRLLSFARRQALEARAVDVGALIDGMCDLIGRSIGPTIHLEVRTTPDLPAAFVDPNQLELSILNLCVNARDAMPDGGTLTIDLAADLDATPFDGAKRGDFVRLSVIDTGCGMDSQTLARAIEPFYTTKGIGKGTGLGLSMVHGLAGQLGGGMTIDSIAGTGTTIRIWLPTSLDRSEVRIDAPVTEFGRPSRSATVLLVDDEELVRFATADVLRDAGYEVIEAASGAEACGIVDAGLVADVLVTDQLMPDMKGSELAGQLKRLQPDLSVLIATGYSDLPDMPFPRISKPFASAHLVERVRMLVEGEPAAVSGPE